MVANASRKASSKGERQRERTEVLGCSAGVSACSHILFVPPGFRSPFSRGSRAMSTRVRRRVSFCSRRAASFCFSSDDPTAGCGRGPVKMEPPGLHLSLVRCRGVWRSRPAILPAGSRRRASRRNSHSSLVPARGNSDPRCC